jgi:hypothetical protein
VIGGLAIVTIATLFFVPIVFSVLHRKKSGQTPATADLSHAPSR